MSLGGLSDSHVTLTRQDVSVSMKVLNLGDDLAPRMISNDVAFCPKAKLPVSRLAPDQR
jgi:hypothetical protein